MSTRRSASLLAAAGLAALGGTAWLAVSLLQKDDQASAVDPGAAAASPDGALEAPAADRGLDLDELRDASGPDATELAASGRTEPGRSGAGRPGVAMLAVEGRVSTPIGLPADERALVLALREAMGARELHAEDGPVEVAWRRDGSEEHEDLLAVAEVDALGSFRLELEADHTRVHLAVAGFYLYSNATLPADVPQRGLVLAPEFGARISGRLVPPEGAAVEELGFEDVELKLGPDFEGGFDAFAIASSASGRHAQVGADGRFELRAVPTAGAQTIAVKPELLAAWLERGLHLRPGEHRELDLPLLRGAILRGVARSEDGAPVAGAKVGVRLRGLLGRALDDVRSAETDERGGFTLAAVMPGAVELHARVDGFRDAVLKLEGELVDGEERAGIELALEAGESIAGVVRFADRTPAAGAEVEASVVFNPMSPMSGDFDREFSTTADDEGRFALRGLAGGRYAISARHELAEGEKAGKWRGRADGIEAGVTDVDLLLEAPIVLRGLVLAAPGGEPIERFEVIASLKGSGAMFGIGAERESEHFTERADGSFTLEGLRAGGWEVRVRADGFGGSPLEFVELPQGPNSAPIEFHLPPAGSVSGIVVDPDGLPVPRAMVRPELDLAQRIEASENSDPRTAMSDAQGRFLVEGLDPGTVQLIATREGFAASAPVSCDVVAGSVTADVTLELRRGGTLTGEVFDDEGRPDSGATVIVQRIPSYTSQHMLRTNTDGRFQVDHLEPGSWQVVRTMDLFGGDSEVPGTGEGGTEAMSDFLSSLQIEMAELSEGGTTHVVLGAPPEDPVQLTCTVMHAGVPMPGVLVSLMPDGADSMGALRLKVTDDQGRFEVELEEPGGYHVTVQTGSVGMSQNNIEFFEQIPAGASEHRITLELPGARISGRVTLKGKGPLANCRVTLHVDGGVASDSFYGGHYTETSTDDSGAYEVGHLRPGSYSLAVGGAPLGGLLGGDSEGGRTVISGVRVGDGEWVQGVDFEIEPAGELQGIVRDLDGRPVEGAAVFVRDEEGHLLERFSLVTTDASGRFQFKGIAPGRYTLSARLGERASPDGAPVRVSAEANEPAVVTLEPGTLLLVSVVDPEGKPVRSRLSVTDSNGREYAGMMTMAEVLQGFARRASFEERAIGPLPPGNFRVRAVLDDGREAEKPVQLSGRTERKVELRIR